MRAWLGIILLSNIVTLTAGCTRHIVLRADRVTVTRAQDVYWLCRPGQSECKKGGVRNPSDWNQSGTVSIPLSSTSSTPLCSAGIAEILLRRVNKPKKAEAHVVCVEPATGPDCPNGARPVPDIINGGMKCPEERNDG